MQPYFFPYIGYFQLINAVNKFIIYDDVNYINKGWINRNNILVNNSPNLIQVPLIAASQNRLIKDILLVDDNKWKDKLLNGEEITITDRNITRFYWHIDEAIKLIFHCLANATSSEAYLPQMKSMVLGDILEAMTRKYLPKDKVLIVNEIGLQKGENMHECLIMNGPTSANYDKYTIDEIEKMI